ncbi:MAG: adenylate kinase [Dehalococcoidia bacterium]
MLARVVLLGPPGAGKGTQAKLLAERLDLVHLASGDLFRSNMAQGTPLGRRAQEYVTQGLLVPDNLTIAMVLEAISSLDQGQSFLLDGFPRTVVQAEALDEALGERRQPLDLTLLLSVPREELVQRLGGRLTCRSCQAPYQVRSSPLRQPGLCDICGGELYQREDDTPEAVSKRLEVYHTQTAPLVDYYQQQGKLVEVDGLGTVEEVHARLSKALEAVVGSRAGHNRI